MDAITILQIGLGMILIILVYDTFRPVKNLEHLSEAEFKEIMKKPKEYTIIDVRNAYEYEISHIKGAINLPLSKIKRKKVEIPTDKNIILYCQTGIRSKQAAKVIRIRHKDMPLAHIKGGLYSLKTKSASGEKRK